MAYEKRMIESPDGRVLEVATIGDPSRPAVFFHHGTPGSASLVRTIEELATKGELFLVTMSRAGYGTSTRQEGRDVAAAVPDTRTVLDALGIDRYAVVGWLVGWWTARAGLRGARRPPVRRRVVTRGCRTVHGRL